VIIKIDPEFEKRIPRLRPDELELLEKSLLFDGCLEPLTTWGVKGDDIIIDGHNRFRLCEKLGVTFTINRIEFDSRDEALLWIDRHQLGRRNLNDTQRTVIANRVAEHLIALRKKAPRVCLDASSNQHNTREEVAKEANVPARKLREVQAVVRAKPELEEKLLSGEVSLIAARKEVRDEQAPSPHDGVTPTGLTEDQLTYFDKEERRHNRVVQEYAEAIESLTIKQMEILGTYEELRDCDGDERVLQSLSKRAGFEWSMRRLKGKRR